MENSIKIPQKIKNRITTWSSSPTPGHTSRQNYNSKRYQHYSQQSIHGKNLNVPQGMNGLEDMVHIYSGILLTYKKEQYNAICSNMDATRESYTK